MISIRIRSVLSLLVTEKTTLLASTSGFQFQEPPPRPMRLQAQAHASGVSAACAQSQHANATAPNGAPGEFTSRAYRGLSDHCTLRLSLSLSVMSEHR